MVDNSWGGLPTKVLDILPPWLTNLTTYTCKKKYEQELYVFFVIDREGRELDKLTDESETLRMYKHTCYIQICII